MVLSNEMIIIQIMARGFAELWEWPQSYTNKPIETDHPNKALQSARLPDRNDSNSGEHFLGIDDIPGDRANL